MHSSAVAFAQPLEHALGFESWRVADAQVRRPVARQAIDGRQRHVEECGQPAAIKEARGVSRFERPRNRLRYVAFELVGDGSGDLGDERSGGRGSPKAWAAAATRCRE
ncbi:MAG TPA: hypothetical protein VIK01_09385 [Polyangiaceae bacterium]